METRKIQKVGGSTFTVSVPKQWASEFGIEAGSEVFLSTHIDGTLVVQGSRDGGSVLERAVLEVADPTPETIHRILEAAYDAGFETVELRADAPFGADQHRAVTAVTRRLVGMEVLATTEDRIAVRTLLDAGEVSVPQSVGQSKFVALSMHRTASAALVGETSCVPDRLFDRDDEVDRLFQMVARHFNRSLVELGEIDDLGVDRWELFAYRETARQLERVADHAVDVVRIADRLSARPPEDVAGELLAIADDARTTVDDATAVVLSDAPVVRAHEALEGYRTVRDRVRTLEERLRDDAPIEDPLVFRALGSLERTAANGANVARTALRTTTREPGQPRSEPVDSE
jgi:phosphate uptake regulator